MLRSEGSETNRQTLPENSLLLSDEKTETNRTDWKICAVKNRILPYEFIYIISGIWNYIKSDIFINENYIDKKILIFDDKFTDFFVKCKRKLDFLSGMIYSNKRVE